MPKKFLTYIGFLRKPINVSRQINKECNQNICVSLYHKYKLKWTIFYYLIFHSLSGMYSRNNNSYQNKFIMNTSSSNRHVYCSSQISSNSIISSLYGNKFENLIRKLKMKTPSRGIHCKDKQSLYSNAIYCIIITHY